jgi:phosphoglycolate phosphatase
VSRFNPAEQRFRSDSPLIAEPTPVFAALWARTLGRAASAQFIAEVDRLFAEAAVAHLTPIDDPPALLGALARRGYRLGLITNDAEANTRAQARQLGINHLLDFIAGYDSGFGAKPQPGPVLAFAAAVDVAPQEIAAVGDAAHDLIAARTAGAVPVGVRTGMTQDHILARYADSLIGSIADLPVWLEQR